jgi:hypothetical protein
MSESVFDILRTVAIEKNNFTQSEWVAFVDDLERAMEMRK